MVENITNVNAAAATHVTIILRIDPSNKNGLGDRIVYRELRCSVIPVGVS
jgi:hypothetical protein